MIKHIFIREIQDHLFKLRFLLLGSVLVLLFVFATLAFISYYINKVAAFESPQQSLDKNVEYMSKVFGNDENDILLHMFIQNPISAYRSPQPMWFCINGNNDALPNFFTVGIKYSQEVKSENRLRDENPWVKKFGIPDWIYIIGILGSFIAIALTYDAFTGEKEDGTLRLLLSNNIPRYKVLIGKFLGAFFALFIPLVIGQLVSLIILNVSGSITLGMNEYQKIAGIVVLSWMYLTVFISMGLFVSSLTHNSSSSLIILLFLWIVSTVIIPGSSSIFARSIYKLPSNEKIDKEAWNFQVESSRKLSGETITRGRPNTVDISTRLSTTEMAEIMNEASRLEGELRDGYRKKKFAQVEIARAFARMSPMSTFGYGAEALAGVGLVRQKHLINQMLAYKTQLSDFILSEEQRLSDDPKGIINFMTIPKKPMNSDAIPVFQEQRMTIHEGFGNALLDMALLMLYGLVFFTGAYASFNRYDVR